MISQHWSRWWLGAVGQQAVTWTNCHMLSLGHNELTHWGCSNILKWIFLVKCIVFWIKFHCSLLPRIQLIISQCRFKCRLGALRQQAITWASVNPDLCLHMVLLEPNDLIIFLMIFMSICTMLSNGCQVGHVSKHALGYVHFQQNLLIAIS